MSAEIESAQALTQKLEGLGTRRKRVEDVRFAQGKGNYIDDLKLPGMLFGDFVRSPYGHARVKSINKDAALELPGVKAVLTAEDLKPLSRVSSTPSASRHAGRLEDRCPAADVAGSWRRGRDGHEPALPRAAHRIRSTP